LKDKPSKYALQVLKLPQVLVMHSHHAGITYVTKLYSTKAGGVLQQHDVCT